ncbi:MAG TPA: MmcQ/YjbR family DNA-binding protein [Polyangiaceae bacterium]|nr:MmcQ/YjbR family DNA-binding protein [Polyangiaceae bacterium]
MPRKTPLDRVRAICMALPEATERPSHGAPTFFIAGKKTFVTFHDDHHGDGILGFWCAAPSGVQAELVGEEPERFYVPAYVGHRGWIGVRLDRSPDWKEVAEIIEDAYRTVAGPRHLELLDAK